MINFNTNYLNKVTSTLVFLLLFAALGFSTNYYVCAEGNDSNSGKSPTEPWQTINKVNELIPFAGDSIFFRRGDSWSGKIRVTASGKEGAPIYYGAYGTGSKPLIYGSQEIKNWSNYKRNIYIAQFEFPVEQLFVDASRVRVARFPDEGYLFVNSVESDTIFSSNGLDKSMDYSGATWYGRTRYWFGVIREVVDSESGKLAISAAPSGNIAERQGFVLMDKLEFLTQPGEWYYDESDKTIYLWTPEGDSPANYKVTASVHSDGFELRNVSHIVVDNLAFSEQNYNGIRLISTNKCTISNNDITKCDSYGIHEESRPGSTNLTIVNNTIDRANGGGIWMWVRDSHIANNVIDNTAVFDEIGIKGTTAPNGGSGAEISGVNNLIEYNVVKNSNYNGLFYRGSGTMIQYNHFINSCLYKDDGGAIYTNTSGSGAHIRYNLVIDSPGNPLGYISSRSMAEGIYIDEIAQNVIVEHNTVLNTGDSGIKLHNVGNILVRNNNVMNARYGIFCDKFVGEPSLVTNNVICMTSDSDDYEPSPLFIRVGDYNTEFDNNLYINPFASGETFRKDDYYNFEEWQKETGHDSNSTFINKPLSRGETLKMFYNPTKKVQIYNLNGATAQDTEGEFLKGFFKLEPYTSVILRGKKLDSVVRL